jgi:hypothetical protein
LVVAAADIILVPQEHQGVLVVGALPLLVLVALELQDKVILEVLRLLTRLAVGVAQVLRQQYPFLI